jgi:hypothetical protein
VDPEAEDVVVKAVAIIRAVIGRRVSSKLHQAKRRLLVVRVVRRAAIVRAAMKLAPAAVNNVRDNKLVDPMALAAVDLETVDLEAAVDPEDRNQIAALATASLLSAGPAATKLVVTGNTEIIVLKRQADTPTKRAISRRRPRRRLVKRSLDFSSAYLAVESQFRI